MSDQKVLSFVFVATTLGYEGTSSGHFQLEIPGVVTSVPLPIPQAERETRSWTFEADPANPSTVREILENDIILRGDNPFEPTYFRWTPAAFYLLGKLEDGQYAVICAIEEWPGETLGDEASEPGVADAIELSQFNPKAPDSPSNPGTPSNLDVS